MPEVVGVRFKPAGKIYYFDAEDVYPQVGDAVIVETARGIEYGEIVVGPRCIDEENLVLPLKKVIRIATAEDRATLMENQNKEKEAFVICQNKIEEHQLPMNLIDVEYTFDRERSYSILLPKAGWTSGNWCGIWLLSSEPGLS